MLTLLTTTMLFVLTATAEILGCYTVYLWLKVAGSRWWLLPGAISLGLFAWLLTLHPSSSAGRVYAAYGGVYIATAMLWQWVVEQQRPDRWDLLGAGLCLIGMAIIVLGPRASESLPAMLVPVASGSPDRTVLVPPGRHTGVPDS